VAQAESKRKGSRDDVNLRQIILDLLHEQPEPYLTGVSSLSMIQRWRELEPGLDRVDVHDVHIWLGLELNRMIERGELEEWKRRWYRLTATEWLKRTAKEKEAASAC
jgi:hypothetical protein